MDVAVSLRLLSLSLRLESNHAVDFIRRSEMTARITAEEARGRGALRRPEHKARAIRLRAKRRAINQFHLRAPPTVRQPRLRAACERKYN